jgi:hypothetical protein
MINLFSFRFRYHTEGIYHIGFTAEMILKYNSIMKI